MSFSLTLTDTAYQRLQDSLARSGIDDPIVSFSQDAGVPDPDGIQRIAPKQSSERALREIGLDENGAQLHKVKWHVHGAVFARSEVPIHCIVEVRGIAFSFTPEWQERISGGTLDATDDTLVLLDAAGEVLLPVDLDYLTEHVT